MFWEALVSLFTFFLSFFSPELADSTYSSPLKYDKLWYVDNMINETSLAYSTFYDQDTYTGKCSASIFRHTFGRIYPRAPQFW
jgi:hypothetical protein